MKTSISHWKGVVPIVGGIAAPVIVLAPTRVALLTLLAVTLLGIVTVHQVADRQAETTSSEPARPDTSPRLQKLQMIRTLEARLWNGFATRALGQLEQVSADPAAGRSARSQAHSVLADWHAAAGDEVRAYRHAYLAQTIQFDPGRRMQAPALVRRPTRVDVVILSNLNLPGGTTYSNAAEIEAQTRAGLRTGLIHHPVYSWNVTRSLNATILEHVDDDQVRLLDPLEHVSCDLLIIRVPKLAEQFLDNMPVIDTAQTIFVINQSPQRTYGHSTAEKMWDIGLVHENLQARFGDHLWYPIGPALRAALVDHHAAEMHGVPLADDDWINIIDVDAWQRSGRRPADGSVRIGRHSRDHRSKWPETPELLGMVYPSRPPYEVHVLGGAETPAETLGRLPDRWTVHPFGSMPPDQFLADLDVYVYYTETGYVEAFGRSPMEAMATGVPTILPSQFVDLFGDAATYAEPVDVRAHVDALMADEQAYQWQVDHARQRVREWFGYEAHVRRLANHGVTVRSHLGSHADSVA